MVNDSPGSSKAKLRLPQSIGGISSSGAGGPGYQQAPIPRQYEPYLWPFKLPLVVLTLTSLATVVLSPWPRYQGLLWMLVFFSSCSLVSVVCQAVRMVGVVRRYHSLYCGSSSSSGSGAGGAAAGHHLASHSHSASVASSPSSGSLSTCAGGGKDASCTKVVVLEHSRPGHKGKALRKGHRSNNVSLDATGDCCSDQLESVALVINCEDWSDSSGSGTDWAAGPPRWNHVFVIPNYREDMSTLTATLDALAGHAWAHTYTIVLAMEAKEVGAAHKAGQLQEQFGCSFHSIVFTLHSHEPGEMPGKASNVNSAVRQFYHMVTGDRSSYMLTVMDADALVPFEYVQQLESSSSTAPNAGSNVYAAPVLFEQDSSAVPGIVRATDYMWSALAAQNLNSWFGVGFPISNYSLSLKLAHDIGFWDTWPDAIGEDMHMFIKAFLRTAGVSALVPIHAPINMTHVAGANYVKGLWARFLQAERHMRGIADTAYVLHEWGSCPFSLRKLVMLVACLEAHLIPVVTLTSLVILPVYYNLFALLTTGALANPASLPLPMRVLALLGQGNLVFVLIIICSYESIRSVVRRHVYRQLDNDKHERCWWNCPRYVLHCLNYLTLFVSVWVYTVVPVVLVVGKHMFNIRSMSYIVADKVVPLRL